MIMGAFMEPKEVFSALPIIETNRVLLRMMSLEDIKDIFEYASDPEVASYVTWDYHKSISDSTLYVESVIKKYKEKEVSEWGIISKKENKCIGTCGYLWWLPIHARAEIAFALSKEYWNKGIMTECLREVIKFGFDKMKLNRIEARCYTDNIASHRVLEKAGMTLEGVLKEAIFAKGSYHDLRVYSVLKKEYYLKMN